MIDSKDTFENLSKFAKFADRLVSNDEVKHEFRVCANTVKSIYDSLRPDRCPMSGTHSGNREEFQRMISDVVNGMIDPVINTLMLSVW